VASTPRIAIIHEWLTGIGGSEMVLRSMLRALPDADVFTLVDVLTPAERDALELTGRTVRTSWFQHVPDIRRRYRSLLPLMPQAVRGYDLRNYDVVISNAHAVAHRVRVSPQARHLVHCCSPMRYAWDLRSQYLREAGLDGGLRGAAANLLLDRLQRSDAEAARWPTEYVAISHYIAARIQRAYGRHASVIYPPVDTEYFTPGTGPRGAHYVIASRFVPYKRMPMLVEAFTVHLPDRELIVVGDGPERDRVRAAAGPNVRLVGAAPRAELREWLRSARALCFAADEDFGIVPVEAQACGTPVVAYGVGGARETVVDGETGTFFDAQTPAAVAGAVRRFESRTWSAEACRANAERFASARFEAEFLNWVAPQRRAR